MKAIIVGAGGTTRELLRRLGELWDVAVIDVSEDLLTAAQLVRPFTAITGDGSSALVLRRAGLDEADALVAATGDDDANLEAVKIAQEAGLLRIAAVASNPERAADYRALDIPVIVSNSLAARQIEVVLEPRRVLSTAFADGKAEAIEFRVSPDSPVRGKRLRQLHSDTWVVAAVLRDNQLIIPKGSTRLEAGDRVTVVGAASDFTSIVRTFTQAESRFPLNFGRKAAVALDSEADFEVTVAEALSVVRNSQAEVLTVVHRDPDEIRDPEHAAVIEGLLGKLQTQAEGVEVELRVSAGDLDDALFEMASGESIGMLVRPAPQGRRLLGRYRAAREVARYSELDVPLLLARGRQPYSSIVVPARRTGSGESAGRAAIDLARTSGSTLIGVSAVAPSFVSVADSVDQARQAAAWLREEAAVQDVTVVRRMRRGNPVRILEEFAATANLLVLAFPAENINPLLPGITGHLLARVRSSVLLVPARA